MRHCFTASVIWVSVLTVGCSKEMAKKPQPDDQAPTVQSEEAARVLIFRGELDQNMPDTAQVVLCADGKAIAFNAHIVPGQIKNRTTRGMPPKPTGAGEIWDLTPTKLRCVFNTGRQPAVDISSVAFSPDGRTLFGTDNKWLDSRLVSGTLYKWDTRNGAVMQATPDGAMKSSGMLQVSHDGTYVAVRGDEKTIYRFKCESLEPMSIVELPKPAVTFILTPDDQHVAFGYNTTNTNPNDRSIAVYNGQVAIVPTGGPSEQFAPLDWPADNAIGAITALCISADGHYLAASREYGPARIWKVADRTRLADIGPARNIKGEFDRGFGCKSLAISPDGNIFATGEVSKDIALYSVSDGKLLAREHLPNTFKWIYSWSDLSFHPGGKMLYSQPGNFQWDIEMPAH